MLKHDKSLKTNVTTMQDGHSILEILYGISLNPISHEIVGWIFQMHPIIIF
jgi:hypothetical protein